MKAIHRRRALIDQAGDTLVELLVTVALMSIAIVGIIGGIAEAVQLSGLHRNQTDVSAALVSASEYLKAQPYAPCCSVSSGCASTSAATTLGNDLDTFNQTFGQVESDVPNPTIYQVTDITGTKNCDSMSTDPGIEMVWLKATSNSGKVAQTMYLIKADR
ncbi:MAG TPA: hypothetical protein VMU63_03835 [Acidimicrobiales bacterium]|nr:hypothetical protein [Acidimicrobiales bacterium]